MSSFQRARNGSCPKGNRRRLLLFCLLICTWVFHVQTGLLFSDSFDYPNGPLIGVSGSPWTTYSGTTGQVSVVEGRILLSRNNTEDVHAALIGAPFTPAAGASLYASFTLSVSNLPTSGGGYFAEFKAGGATDLHARIFVGTAGAGSGAYRVGIANAGTSASGMLTNDLNTNANYTVVVRYDVSAATSTLWVNPTAETDASVTATDTASATSVSYFGFREDGIGGAIGTLFVDNLLVGTRFSDVLTNAPQPPLPPDTTGTLSLLTYNLNGNGVADWSTNSPQVQAIGRQLVYLNPDIIAFNEIPYTNTYQMVNWVTAFLPGYFLATNSVTDGSIRSGIASRFPIARSTSWLPHADLNPFGYTNSNFSRDLFEAEINVPAYSQPLHVFVTHLKATSGTNSATYQDAADKRAAEAAAVSNFFVTVFLPGTNSSHPFVLAGDLNEDISRPDTNSYVTGQPIQRLTSATTGLRLTTPLNSITDSELTESIRLPLDVRFDYILPCGLLFSNLVTSQVFRTDVLSPLPPNLLSNDDKTASDHLPVIMYFRNPYATPFRILSIVRSNELVALNWESENGRQYRLETSSNLTDWVTVASNLAATGTSSTFNTNATGSPQFFRVFRQP